MFKNPLRRVWDWLGVASDFQGRLTIVSLAIGGIALVTGSSIEQSVLILVGLLANGLALTLLVSGHWHQEQRMQAADRARAEAWRPPVEPAALGRYLDEINSTMERHGFGRNPNLPNASEESGWSVHLAVTSPPKIGRPALSVSVFSSRGTAPEELQCVVIEPDGSEAIGRDRAELFSQAEAKSRLFVLYPFDFAGTSMDWPLTPGTYKVIAQAIRADRRGMVPHVVAEASFSVDGDGRVDLPQQENVS